MQFDNTMQFEIYENIFKMINFIVWVLEAEIVGMVTDWSFLLNSTYEVIID